MIDKKYITIVKENSDGELYIELPQESLKQLGWEEGDTVEWEDTEIGEGGGEHNGLVLSNPTKIIFFNLKLGN